MKLKQKPVEWTDVIDSIDNVQFPSDSIRLCLVGQFNSGNKCSDIPFICRRPHAVDLQW